MKVFSETDLEMKQSRKSIRIGAQRFTRKNISKIVAQRFNGVYHQLFNNKSAQTQYKSDLIRSWLSQDMALFKKIICNKNLTLSFLDQLLFSTKATSALSEYSLVVELIAKEIALECEKDALLILTIAFQSIPETSFLNANKHCINAGKKKQLLEYLLKFSEPEKKYYIKSLLLDLSFDPVLPPLRVCTKPTKKGIVRTFVAFIDKEMNISEFIIISIGYLRHIDNIDKTFIQKLILNYLFVRFEECVEMIITYFKNNIPTHYQEVVNKSNHLMPFDNLKNDPRRFFETRLAQYINGATLPSLCSNRSDATLAEHTLKSVNKILQFFLDDQGEVQYPRDIEVKISLFAQSYKNKFQFSKKDLSVIKSIRHDDNVIFKGSDRVPRDKETGTLERKFETEPNKIGKDIWNSSGGVLRGISPTFFDAQCGPIRNMLVDATQVAHLDEKKQQWYWKNNRHYTAYVGSISGHTCEVVGMLDIYIKAHLNDPDLEQDLHLFLVQLIAVYVKRGYHSFLEIIDVLHDEPIQKLFAQSKVKIDLYAFLGRVQALPHLESAIKDADQYTKVSLCKRELATNHTGSESLPSTKLEHQKVCLNKTNSVF